MKSVRISVALTQILATCNFSGQATSEPKQSKIDIANRLFQTGKFAEAGKLYSRMAAQNPKDYSAILQLGRIALLSNRLNDAQKWLEKAITLEPGDTDAKVMLAEAFYRRDDFQKAVAALNGVEVSSNRLIISQYPTLNVAKLESFKGQTPYDVHGNGQTTRLKFLKTDPLPLVSLRVNGGDEVTFFIDTGGSEVALDAEFAKELGLPQFGEVQGTFSGGEHANVQQSRIKSLTVGDWTIKNLPVVALALRQLSEGLGVKRIDGCIGTNLLYHFLALPPALLFVDTGLAGAGVKLAEPVIKQAEIELEEDKASEGAGGGGKLKIVPYTVRRLSFGDIQEDNVAGLYDGPFPWQDTFGFHLAGMVGHDFFKPYAVTFDFENMEIFLKQEL